MSKTKITLDEDEIASLTDFIEFYFISSIREIERLFGEDMDNVDYIVAITSAYKKLRDVREKIKCAEENNTYEKK